MLKLEGLKLAPEEKEAALHRRAARLLRIPEEDVLSVQVLRRSIDAREELHLVYTVAAEVRQEKQVLRRCRDRRVSRFAPERYALPEVLSSPEVPPVVVGAGPGGLFAALVLARCGLRPILLERGRDTTARQRDVETFWRTGVLDPESNVQFGEGGAGAFSDGKLNTGTKDLRHRWILEELVRCGAPESILTDAKPHVGTDMLHIALQNLRQELLSLGAQVRFGHRLEGLESRDGVLTGLHVRTGEGTYRCGRWCWRRATAHGIPSKCCTRPGSPWRPSPSPWGSASSTASGTWTPPSTGSMRGIRACRPPPINCRAIQRRAGACSPSAFAPADRWWRRPRSRGVW